MTKGVGYRTQTDTSLVYQILVGEITGVVGGALGYLNDSMVDSEEGRQIVKKKYLEESVFVGSVTEIEGIGKIATLILPRFESEIFDEGCNITKLIDDAMRLAHSLSIKCISLTGLIPSATSHGADLLNQSPPIITTGHATTTACIAINILYSVELFSRAISTEVLSFIGLGSIGAAALRLVVTVLPHSKEIILCDVTQREHDLQSLKEEITTVLGYNGKVTIACSTAGASVNSEVYRSSIIVGATNIGGILSVEKLQKGTIVIDDSAPHIFNTNDMWNRMKNQHDVVATEAGPIRLSSVKTEILYAPKRWVSSESLLPPLGHPSVIMGCTLSSLITGCDPNHFPRQLGTVDLQDSVKHFNHLKAIGCTGAPLSIDDEYLTEQLIASLSL